MSDGYIQQVGTPIELYDNPANLFVASFIGLPPMNFIDMQVGNGMLASQDITIPIPEHLKKALASYEGKTVVLGIRPEDIVEGGNINFKVSVNENLGQNTLVHGVVNKKKLVCKFKEWCEYKADDKLTISFKSDKIHIFDKDTTKVIKNGD